MSEPAITGAEDDPGSLQAALAAVAAGASARDERRDGAFPADAFDALAAAGVLTANAVPGPERPPAVAELSLVRRCAAADGSVARILDGHLNAVERIAVQAPAAVRDAELAAVRAERRVLGVWGGDPVAGEGPRARLRRRDGDEVLRGVKTFCSGAGGVTRALVLARGEDGAPPVLVLCDCADGERVTVDRNWYRSRGLVASASHRVVFHDAPVIARLGAPGAITQQPWFARDALRTAASWAGMADVALAGALAALDGRAVGDVEGLAIGRMLTERGTIDAWLSAAAAAMDAADSRLPALALHGRAAIAAACRRLLDEAARACGSHPFATAGRLDRARRDLEVFLLQHRLDPMLARAGAEALHRG